MGASVVGFPFAGLDMTGDWKHKQQDTEAGSWGINEE